MSAKRTYSDSEWGGTRRSDAAVDRFSVCGLSSVSRGHHNYYPSSRGALDGLAQRIVGDLLRRRRPERHVDDPNRVLRLVRDRPVERLDDIAGLTAAVRVEHAQVDEVRARRHALHVFEIFRRLLRRLRRDNT